MLKIKQIMNKKFEFVMKLVVYRVMTYKYILSVLNLSVFNFYMLFYFSNGPFNIQPIFIDHEFFLFFIDTTFHNVRNNMVQKVCTNLYTSIHIPICST